MKLFKKLTLASVAFAATLGAAKADDLKLVMDKDWWLDGITAMADAAGKASGTTIKVETVTPADKLQAYIQTSIAGGNTPTFFSWWNGGLLRDVTDTGAAADLTALWDKAIADGLYTPLQRDLVSVDGKPYGILLNQAVWVTFYNKDAFAKAGISAPPTTWAELMDDAEKLKAAGYIPFTAPGKDWMPFIWFSQILSGIDPDAFNDINTGKVTYNSDAVKKTFEVWGDMYAKGYFGDPRLTDDQKEFVEGKAAMFVIGDWHSGSFVQAGMNVGSFLMPPVNPEAGLSVILEAGPIIVSKAAADADPKVMEAAAALMGVDASNALGKVSGVYTGNLKAAMPNDLVANDMAMLSAQNPRPLVRWWEAVPSQIQGDLVAAMGEFMLNPTADQATATMEKMNQISSDYWASKQ